MINKVTLVGNLGADPESKTTTSGSLVVNLRVATTSRTKKGETWEDETEWHRVVCFGKTAENAANFLEKGRQVYVEGRIKTNKWTDKEGKDRYTTEILANEVRFLGGKSGSGGGAGARDTGRSDEDAGLPAAEDDIPF